MLRQGVWVEAMTDVEDFICFFTGLCSGSSPVCWVEGLRSFHSAEIAAGLCTGPAGKGRDTSVLASDLCLSESRAAPETGSLSPWGLQGVGLGD